MTSVMIEHVAAPAGARGNRRFDRIRAQAVDGLAGRTVWCATALPAGHAAARWVRDCLCAGGEVAAGALAVQATDPLRPLAERLDDIMRLAAATASPVGPPHPAALGPEAEDVYAQGQRDGEEMLGPDVAPDDVVVLHDALTAVLAQAVRERGAHVVWDVMLSAAPAPGQTTAHDVWDFLRRYTAAIDAFVMTWPAAGAGGHPVERITAVMPWADVVATKEIPTSGAADESCHHVGWSSVLSDVVRQDRGEHVGGTLHARPAVAVR